MYMNAGMAKKMNIKHSMVKEGLAKVQSSRFLGELGSFGPKPVKGEVFIKTLGV